ncbi:MAG: hypothetical protein V4633_05535 [Pseudomonadota bacterium]
MANTARRWLNETSWSYVFGLMFFAVCVATIVSIGAERGSVRHAIPSLAVKAALLLIIAKMLAQGIGLRELPARVLAWARMDQANLRACAHWIMRRPHAPPPPGQAISFLEKSAYSTTVAMVMFGTFVDLPLNAMIATVMSPDPVIQTRMHIVFSVLAIYSLVWVFGDRHLMQGSYCVVGATHLDIRIAGRLEAHLPRSAILRCEPTGEGGAAGWCKQHGVAGDDMLVSTPADSATIMLEIDPAAGVKLTSWQRERKAPRYLFLFVDQPSMIMSALKT